MLQWTWDAARRVQSHPSHGTPSVVIATDDPRIAEAARGWGANVAMTSEDCPSGSDRCAEVLDQWEREHPDRVVSIVVNLQGDEPFLDPAVPTACLELFQRDPSLQVTTPIAPLVAPGDQQAFLSPHVVKVAPAIGANGVARALLFSRSPLPCPERTTPADNATVWSGWLTLAGIDPPKELLGFKHLGLYAFRRAALKDFVKWPPSPLEKLEKLEQLRLLEHGVSIGLAPVVHEAVGIDTPQDLERAQSVAQTRLVGA